jgi:WD40 repeat protein
VWEAKSGKILHRLQGHADEVTSANFSADGKWIITSSKDATARVWDASTGHQITVLAGHSDWVNRAEFSPDSRLALTASRDKTTLVWQRYGENEWRVKARLFGHTLSVVRARFSSGSESVVTASKDGTARVWRLNESLPPPPPGLTPTKSSPVKACDVCWPSSEEIYTLAANRIRHANSRLDPVGHFHDTRYKIIRRFIPKRIE